MKKHMISMTDRIWALRGLLTAFCVVAVLWCVSFVSHADTVKGTITGSNVNVRETASTTATAVATLSTNDLVDVIAETTGDDDMKWYKVTTESGVTGYVRSDLIKKATVTVDVTQTDSKTAYIAGSNANIRQDASTSSGRVANARGGSQITIIGEATGADGYKWYQIEFVGNGTTMTGFIRSDLVTFEAPTQDPEITEIEGEMGEGNEPQEGNSEEEPVSEEPSVEVPSEDVNTEVPVDGDSKDLTIMEPVSALETIPEGFEQTELQLGDDIFTVWGKGQFYIMYASVNGGEPQFYLYDTTHKSYVAYTGLLSSNDVVAPEEEKELNYKLIAIICIAIIAIMAVVIGILAYKLSNAGYIDDDDDDDDDDDYYTDDDDDDDEYVDLSDDEYADNVSVPETDEVSLYEGMTEEIPVNTVYETSEAMFVTEEPVQSYEMPVEQTAPVYETDLSATMVYETPAYMNAEEYAYEEEADTSAYSEEEDAYDEEEVNSKGKKGKKEKLSKRLLDFFTVEVDEEDDDDDDEEDIPKKKSKSKASKTKESSVHTFDDDDDDDLNFIDL